MKKHHLPQNNPSLETNFPNILFQHNVIVFHQITDVHRKESLPDYFFRGIKIVYEGCCFA